MYVCMIYAYMYICVCMFFYQVSYLRTCYVFMEINIDYIKQFIVKIVILMYIYVINYKYVLTH